MESKTMTVRDVAVYLGVHTDMVYRLVRQRQRQRQRQIPHMRLGSRVLFTQKSFQSWIQEQEEKSLNSEERSQ